MCSKSLTVFITVRCAVFALVLSALPIASAQAYFVQYAFEISSRASGGPLDFEQVNTGELQQSFVGQALTTVSSTSAFGVATVSLEGSAALGSLKTRVNGSATNSRTGVPSTIDVRDRNGWAEWGDTMTITSGGTFAFTVDLHSQVTGSPIAPAIGTNDPGVERGSHVRATFAINNITAITLIDQLDDGNQGSQLFSDTVEMNFNSGQQVELKALLQSRAFADSYNGVDVQFLLDSLNTANFYIDPVTSGASYTTESGVNYMTPIPLPGAAWLFGSALGLLGWVKRKTA